TNVIHLGGTSSKKITSKTSISFTNSKTKGTSQTNKSKTKIIEPEDKEEQLSNTIVSKSSVRLNKNAPFYDSFGKELKKTAKKNTLYKIYQIKTLNNHTYYKTKSDLWLLAKSTSGEVWYNQASNNTMILTTDKKGNLFYSVYNPAPTVTSLITKHNAYVYNNAGQLRSTKYGTITLIKKGTVLKGYSIKRVAGKKFYITNHGWIKYNNLEKVKIRKK
ncbi:MAG: SLAP domain-containing protein, partial [Lactobacillus sp.]|nr:SLAP domain-containing protein [Lactobacillus sp.]